MKSLWHDPLRPYLAPFFVYGLFLILADFAGPSAAIYLYPVKTIAVAAMLALSWRELPAFQLSAPITSALVGVAGFIGWVGLDPLLVHHASTEGGYNPFTVAAGPIAYALLVFRIAGAALVVPIMEEILWRGFLMRYLIPDPATTPEGGRPGPFTGLPNEHFEQIPLGTYRPLSFCATTAAFASIHGAQWPLGIVVGLLYGWWFVRTRSLGNIMVAHGVTNLLLGAYVIATGRWYFW